MKLNQVPQGRKHLLCSPEVSVAIAQPGFVQQLRAVFPLDQAYFTASALQLLLGYGNLVRWWKPQFSPLGNFAFPLFIGDFTICILQSQLGKGRQIPNAAGLTGQVGLEKIPMALRDGNQ